MPTQRIKMPSGHSPAHPFESVILITGREGTLIMQAKKGESFQLPKETSGAGCWLLSFLSLWDEHGPYLVLIVVMAG